MTVDQVHLLENRLIKIRQDNKSLRQELAALKKERAELKKTLNTLDLVYNNAPTGVGLVQQGKLIGLNKTALSILGYFPEEIIGHDLMDIIPSDHRTSMKERLKNWMIQKKIPADFETCLLTRNNDPLPCDVRVNKIRLNGRTAFILSITDSEERKIREKERLASQKNIALITLSSGIAGRLSRYLHPLAASLNCLREASANQNNQFRESVRYVEDISNAFQRTIQQLNRLNSRPHPLENLSPGTVNDLIQKAMAIVQSRLSVSSAPPIDEIFFKTFYRSKSIALLNPDEIQEALVHLLMNACEATPEGGDIFITTEEHDDFVHIYIQDNGTGIPEEVMDRIFDPFYTSRGQHSGLGLSIARSIINRNHGTLEVTSLEDQGTTFHVRLPLEKSKPLTLDRSKKKKKLGDNRLLIIYHDPLIRELISQLFREKGCQVINASTGLEGRTYVKRSRFDLLITDVPALGRNPDLFISRYRQANVASVVVGIWPQSSTTKKGLLRPNLDFDLVFSEPVDLQRLVKEIVHLLKNGRIN